MKKPAAIVFVPVLALAACNAPRALPSVRDHGDRAFNRGDFQTARADYQEYLTRKPGEAEVELMLARTLLASGDFPAALTHAQTAYDLKPGQDPYIETYAEALLRNNKTDQLYRELRSLAQDRGTPSDWVRLGRFTARTGDADGAEHALLTGARLDQGRSAAIQLALADFYRSIGAHDKERLRLRMAFSLDPQNPEIPQRLRELGEIPGPSLALPPEERDSGMPGAR
jgi:cytochrome c-type biogenesis protein CcmH/NrfG